MTFPIFDSHCHLDAEQFDADRDAVIERALSGGLTGMVIPATDLASCHKTVEMVRHLSAVDAYGAVGVHPHEAKDVDPTALDHIEVLAQEARIVAIGETGLDYHYNFSPPEEQRASLRAHVRIAVRRQLPMILHCRNAEEDLLTILEEEKAPGGVVHCFTGEWPTAERLLAMGYFLGFTGIITFRNADALREVVKRVPLDRILLETDSPYLAPMPYRGKRNEPSFLHRVAETVASLHGIAPEQAAARAEDNTRRCFRIQ